MDKCLTTAATTFTNSNGISDAEGDDMATIMTWRTVHSPPQERPDDVKFPDGKRPIPFPPMEGVNVALFARKSSNDPSTPTEGLAKNMLGGRDSAELWRNPPPRFQGFGNIGRSGAHHFRHPACTGGCLCHRYLVVRKTQQRIIFVDRRGDPINVGYMESVLIPARRDDEFVWCLIIF